MLLGIDPGLSGALAFFEPSTNDMVLHDMPVVDGQIDGVTLGQLISAYPVAHAIIEQVGAMPKQGLSSTFKFGMTYGAALGVLGALKVPTRRVVPAKWKRYYGLTSEKEKSRFMAISLWPKAAADLKRKKDADRSEAALLAGYLWHLLKADGVAPGLPPLPGMVPRR